MLCGVQSIGECRLSMSRRLERERSAQRAVGREQQRTDERQYKQPASPLGSGPASTPPHTLHTTRPIPTFTSYMPPCLHASMSMPPSSASPRKPEKPPAHRAPLPQARPTPQPPAHHDPTGTGHPGQARHPADQPQAGRQRHFVSPCRRFPASHLLRVGGCGLHLSHHPPRRTAPHRTAQPPRRTVPPSSPHRTPHTVPGCLGAALNYVSHPRHSAKSRDDGYSIGHDAAVPSPTCLNAASHEPRGARVPCASCAAVIAVRQMIRPDRW